jgi:23S rRNA (guanosine2251-2'-O)-methyltransferase
MDYLTGFHAIEERIKSARDKGQICGPLLVAKAGPRAREIVNLAIDYKVRVDRTGSFELDRLAPDNRGIALAVDDLNKNSPDISLDEFISGLGDRADALVIILDDITDPHNYGAILRCCDQFGVDLVISRNRRNAKHADTISRTSAGTAAWVPQAEIPNLVRAVEQLKNEGFWLYGADMQGEPAYTKDLRGRLALVFGSEGTGISRLLREACDGLLGIPSKGRIDSLNVSVAAGILLYEVLRQRAAKIL